jgi:hypothetical protein
MIAPLRVIPMLSLLSLAAVIAAPTDPLPKSLIPYFAPPAEFAGQLGGYRSPLRFADGAEVKTADDWKRRREEILRKWTDLMGPQPEPIAKPKLEILDSEHDGNFTRHHIKIEVAPGKMTDDAYLLVPDGKGPFPAVLVVFYDALTGIGKKGKMRDYALQLAKRGFVTLSLGSAPETYYPNREACKLQPLSYHAYEASNCRRALANLPEVDGKRIGVVGHSYGGKWAMFASCLDDEFACAAWSDPGIVFDEKRSNVNYWEPWYLGFDGRPNRKPGIPTEANPRTGPYKRMMELGMDLHELHALMAPRPFLVSGGSEDPPERWKALNHSVAVNKVLGYENRVGMTNRKTHDPPEESNARLSEFFEHFLKPNGK